MKIGEFSKRTGLSVTTIRYYDKIGVLEARREGENRVYSPEDVERAMIIIFLQEMNFNLSEIKKLLDLDQIMEKCGEGNIPPEIIKEGVEILEEKNRELSERMDRMKEAIAYVQYLMEKMESLRGEK